MILSLDAQKAIYEQETSDYPIFLLTFEHPDLEDPIRISSDNTTRLPGYTTDEQVIYGTVSNSVEYIYCPLEINLPTEDDEEAPQTSLTISNVGREMVTAIRSLRASPTMRMVLVLSSNTDNVEGDIGGFVFSDVDINEATVTGNLVMNIMTNEPFPYRTCTPSTTPGLFK